MIQKQIIDRNLDRVFNPRNVAIVGDKQATGYSWLRSLSTFKGKLYSVQIDPKEIAGIGELGVDNYLSLLDIPGPVDYVIAAVPRAVAPKIVRDCINKEVGGVCFFTSGFAETGTEEGIRLQQELTILASRSNLNVIGPNCVGIYNPRIGLRHIVAQDHGQPGTVGFISQSGTHAILFSTVGSPEGIKISKSVSYGNAIVLDSTDYMEYLGSDGETDIIGMYIEGVKDGKRFFRCLRDVACRKPVLIWKGGETEQGARATASHTGSLAESGLIWNTLIKQCGAIRVSNLDEMIDTVKALIYIKRTAGSKVGLIAMSGGQSVVIADTFAKAGLDIPLLTDDSYRKLASFFNIIGGSYRNPFDISSTFLASNVGVDNLSRMLDVMDGDPNIDTVVLELFPAFRPFSKDPEASDPLLDAISDFKKRAVKPFIVIVTPANSGSLAFIARDRLMQRGIPSFSSFDRAAQTLKRLVEYYKSKALS